MNILIFSYNTKGPFACLIKNNKISLYLKEIEYYKINNPRQSFPESAIEHILINTNKIDYVVFIGKPFIYLRDFIIKHIYLFPRTFSSFSRDLSNHFKKIMQIPKTIKLIKTENQLMTKINLDAILYTQLDEALAYDIEIQGDALIITCLSDVFEGNSFYYFKKSNKRIFLDAELNILSSFSNLLKIYYDIDGKIHLGKIIYDQKNKFRFNKKYVTLKNNSFVIKKQFLNFHKKFNKVNEQVLLNQFAGLMGNVNKNGKKIVFISDMIMPTIITKTYGNIKFKYVNDVDKLKAVGKYLINKIHQIK